jgi:phosphoserine phosphatase RsbU/P
MQKKLRLTYILSLILLIAEVLSITLDGVLFYSGDAKTYLVSSGVLVVKDVLATLVLGSMYILIRQKIRNSANSGDAFWVEPDTALKRGCIMLAIMLGVIGLYSLIFSESSFQIDADAKALDQSAGKTDIEEKFLLPLTSQSLYTVFRTHVTALSFAGFALAALVVLERLILFRRQRNTKANFIMMVVFLSLGALFLTGNTSSDRSSMNVLSIAFFSVGGLMAIVNVVRLSWVLPMARHEKIRALLLIPLVLAGIFSMTSWLDARNHLNAYSTVASWFLRTMMSFGIVYLIAVFLSLLFYLPTSDAFEKKATEVRNLYAMSKFITEVFDEEKIYDTLVSNARDACGVSSSVWLDMYQPYTQETRDLVNLQKLPTVQWREKNGRGFFKTVAQQNISLEFIHRLAERGGFIWQDVVEHSGIVRIDDAQNDPRLNGKAATTVSSFVKKLKAFKTPNENALGSMVAVPLMARSKLIGALCVAKDVEYGFVREDLELITTFADQAAIAIDNARLIRELIDKERLQQELLVAQKIQLRLLPQSSPKVEGFDIDGVSYPAYEVGGDYYDFVELEKVNGLVKKFGIVIADVSGKGTSAAFYMAELKGIIQSLARIYPDAPTDLLIKANETIARGLDKSSFISALYAALDADRKTLTLANAGHCPMVLIKNDSQKIVRLKGLALGLDKGTIFNKTIMKEDIYFEIGDVAVFYTDGVIEAVSASGEQFGYDRLMETAARSRNKGASDIKSDIFAAVNYFTENGGAVTDDLTIVVIKRTA